MHWFELKFKTERNFVKHECVDEFSPCLVVLILNEAVCLSSFLNRLEPKDRVIGLAINLGLTFGNCEEFCSPLVSFHGHINMLFQYHIYFFFAYLNSYY